MPGILQHHSLNATKLMVIGESGSGKTGALMSLLLAGYKLRILDFDNGVDILRNYCTDPKSPYYAAMQKIDVNEALKYQTFTEKMKQIAGRIIPANATVWKRAMMQLDHWQEYQHDEEGNQVLGPDKKPVIEIDLGHPRDWDNKTILVLDSLSKASDAAMNFQQQLNGQLGVDQGHKGYEMRTDIRLAQAQVRKMMELLYDDDFKPNVILISHILYRTPEGSATIGEFGKRGYPETVGVALSPKIPRYFNNVVQVITEGSGTAEKHKIVTDAWGGVSAKSSAPSRVKPVYDISTGLAEFFADVRGEPKWTI